MTREKLPPLDFERDTPVQELLAPENCARIAGLFSLCNQFAIVERHDALLPTTMSSARPSGELARPWASRSSALRIVLTGTPYCRAIEQTTAESFAAASMSEPARPLPRKISARVPSFGKYEMVAT